MGRRTGLATLVALGALGLGAALWAAASPETGLATTSAEDGVRESPDGAEGGGAGAASEPGSLLAAPRTRKAAVEDAPAEAAPGHRDDPARTEATREDTFAARVYVTDEASGRPIVAARIAVDPQADGAGPSAEGPPRAVTTDGQGRALVPGLPREGERAAVRVVADGHAPIWRRVESPETGFVTPVAVSLTPLGWLSGRAVDFDGEPLPRIRVRVHGALQDPVRTDERGRFGPVEVPVHEASGADVRLEVSLLGSLGSRGSVTLHLTPGETRADVEVRLAPPDAPRRYGQGLVVLPDGRPAAGAWVHVRGRHFDLDDRDAPLEGSAYADARGRFRLTLPSECRLAPPCWIAATLPGFASAMERAAAREISDLRLVLGLARRLEGRAVYDDGSPAVGADIEARRLGTATPGTSPAGRARRGEAAPDEPEGPVVASARAERDGTFVLEDLPQADVVVTATVSLKSFCGGPRSWRGWRAEPQGAGAFEIEVPLPWPREPTDVPPPEPQEPEAPPPEPRPRLTRIALVGPDGSPAAGRDVFWTLHDAEGHVVCDALTSDGSIERELVPGTYRLRGSGRTVASFDASWTVTDGGDPADVRVEVGEGTTVGGPVEPFEGLEPADVQVRLVAVTDGDEERTSGVEEGGRLVVRHLVPGVHRVEATVLGRPDLVVLSPANVVVGRGPLEVRWRIGRGVEVPIRLEVAGREEMGEDGERTIRRPEPRLEVLDEAGAVRIQWSARSGIGAEGTVDEATGLVVVETSAWLPPGRHRVRAVVDGAVVAETSTDVALDRAPEAVVLVVRP